MNPRVYDGPALYFGGSAVTLSEFAPVPEPGTWLLMSLRLCALLIGSRRVRTAA